MPADLQVGLAADSREISPTEFSSLRAHWNDLVFAAERPNLFLTWEWLQAWLETDQGNGPRPWILGVWAGDELVGGAPLCLDGRTVRFLGSTELVADYVDVLARPGSERDVIEALLGAIRRSRRWTVVQLDGFESGALVERLAASLAQSGISEREECGICPVLEVAGGWQQLLQRRFDGKRRYNIQRDMRLAQERHGLARRTVTDADHLPAALDVLFQLHRARKADQGIASDFAEGRIAAFHRRAASRFLEAGWLALDIVERNGRPVAASYGFQLGGRFWLYQTGMDPASASTGAGTFALASCVARCADDGTVEFEFLRGDEPYKRLWADRHRVLWSCRLYHRNVCGWIGHGVSLLRRRFARLVRRRRGDGNVARSEVQT